MRAMGGPWDHRRKRLVQRGKVSAAEISYGMRMTAAILPEGYRPAGTNEPAGEMILAGKGVFFGDASQENDT